MNEVSVEWLRTATEAHLRHLEATHGPQVSLEQDYFWSIDPVDRYDVTMKPKEFTLGSLADGVEVVQSMMQDGVVLNYRLV